MDNAKNPEVLSARSAATAERSAGVLSTNVLNPYTP